MRVCRVCWVGRWGEGVPVLCRVLQGVGDGWVECISMKRIAELY